MKSDEVDDGEIMHEAGQSELKSDEVHLVVMHLAPTQT